MLKISYGGPFLALFALVLLIAAEARWTDDLLANMSAQSAATGAAPVIMSFCAGRSLAKPFPTGGLLNFATVPRCRLQ
jgi:hypothetical protein